MKRSGPKKKSHIRTKNKSFSVIHFRYIGIGLGLLAIVIAGNMLVAASTTVHVLGASTSSLLARGGDDSSGESNTSEQHSDSGSNSNSGSTSSNSESQRSTNTPITTTIGIPQSDTKVDCIGPDGKHFVTSFHDCRELNIKWNNTNFKFTKIGTSSQSTELKTSKSGETQETNQSDNKKLEIKTENKKTEVNIEKSGTHIEIKREDNGELHVSSKKEDGTEVKLEESGTLEKLNDSLRDQDIEIGTGSATKFAFRSGKVETHTDFPLSIDPATKQLSVTTPSGIHELTILPDHAVQNLINLKIFSNILATADSNTASAEASNNVINLTEINNQPAFEIDGVSDKKLFGIFPIAFTKKVFVSSDNGKILKTQQSAVDSFLEKISF